MAAPVRSARTIDVVGLRDLRRELRRVATELPKELAEINFKVADIVAKEMRRLAPEGPHQGGGRVTPIRESIKAGRQQARGVIAIGGARSPHALPINFGGTLRRHASASRTTVVSREYIYSALAAKQGEAIERYGDLIDDLMRRAFPTGTVRSVA